MHCDVIPESKKHTTLLATTGACGFSCVWLWVKVCVCVCVCVARHHVSDVHCVNITHTSSLPCTLVSARVDGVFMWMPIPQARLVRFYACPGRVSVLFSRWCACVIV